MPVHQLDGCGPWTLSNRVSGAHTVDHRDGYASIEEEGIRPRHMIAFDLLVWSTDPEMAWHPPP